METLEQVKVKVEELVNKGHKLSFESEELFCVVLDYLFASVTSKEDMHISLQKLQELLKSVGGDESLAQQVREACRVVEYLSGKGKFVGWKEWSV